MYIHVTYKYEIFDDEDQLIHYLNNEMKKEKIISIYSRDNKIVLVYSWIE